MDNLDENKTNSDAGEIKSESPAVASAPTLPKAPTLPTQNAAAAPSISLPKAAAPKPVAPRVAAAPAPRIPSRPVPVSIAPAGPSMGAVLLDALSAVVAVSFAVLIILDI